MSASSVDGLARFSTHGAACDEEVLARHHLGEFQRDRDLPVSPALQVVEKHHLTLRRREPLQGREEPLPEHHPPGVSLHHGAVLHPVGVASADPAVGDCLSARWRTLWKSHAAKREGSRHWSRLRSAVSQGLLRGVLRVGRMAQHREGHGVAGAEVAVGERLHGWRVAAPCPNHEVAVGGLRVH